MAQSEAGTEEVEPKQAEPAQRALFEAGRLKCDSDPQPRTTPTTASGLASEHSLQADTDGDKKGNMIRCISLDVVNEPHALFDRPLA